MMPAPTSWGCPVPGSSTESSKRILLILLIFALPWSSDLPSALGGVFSKLYNFAVAGLILHWFFSCRKPWSCMPKAYGVFVGFILVHNLVTWVFLHPGELSWDSVVVDLGVKLSTREASGILLVKNTLNIFLGFALAYHIRQGRDLRVMTWALLLSLGLLLVVGDVQSSLASGDRFLGGFSNPNAFAEIPVLLGWLGLAVLLETPRSGQALALGGVSILMAGVLLLLSASRGAIVAMGFGVAAFFFMSGGRLGGRNLLLVLALLGVLVLTPQQVYLQLVARSQTVSEDNVRLFIWANYISHWREFIWGGVGLGREMSVIDDAIKGGRIWNPHNTYLGTLVGLGVLGLILLLNLVGAFARDLFSVARKQRGSEDQIPAMMLGMLIVFAVMLFFGDRLNSRTTWIFLGILGGFLNSQRVQGRVQPC